MDSSNVLYTVMRVNKKDELYGKIHGSNHADKTLCGLEINENWWIVSNAFDGEITCPKCLKSLF